MSGDVTQESVTLGGVQYPVKALPFKQLRVLTPVFMRVGYALSRGDVSEAMMDDMGTIVAASMGKTMEEFGEIVMGQDELADAFKVAAEVTGMAPKDNKGVPASGEATAGRGTGTTSTPTSSPAPAGPGSTSTST